MTDAYELALDESSTAGKPPLERQHVQQRLADIAMEIEAARLLIQRAAWMGRAGVPMTGGQGSMSKLKGGDVAMWATTACMDLVGPFAQSKECPLEKWFRDAKIYQLFEGTAEIQRMVISRMQAQEYRDRFGENLEAAIDATRSGAAAAINGASSEQAATNGAARPESSNGAGGPEREAAGTH
jgi:alkylation response protein AidB-like acyl-CoA dehydrogenase